MYIRIITNITLDAGLLDTSSLLGRVKLGLNTSPNQVHINTYVSVHYLEGRNTASRDV